MTEQATKYMRKVIREMPLEVFLEVATIAADAIDKTLKKKSGSGEMPLDEIINWWGIKAALEGLADLTRGISQAEGPGLTLGDNPLDDYEIITKEIGQLLTRWAR